MSCGTLLRVIQGDTGRWTFSFVDSGGAVLDLTGAIVAWSLVTERGESPAVLTYDTDTDPEIVITDAPGGVVTLTLSSMVTAALDVGSFLYTIVVTLPGPPITVVTPVNGAPFRVIARAAP